MKDHTNFAIFPQMDGIFILNKPSGPSSAHCLKIFKRLGQKKIGHGGTLDPMASGVLLVLLGQATKLADHLHQGGIKTYRGKLRLGLETDTWDITGKIIHEKNWSHIEPKQVEEGITEWLQLKQQEVPAFSAARHNGQKLYELARKGIDTPVKIKKICVSRANMLSCDLPFVSFRTSCSSGSYIRSLAHSLGTRLGCGATLVELVREYSHPFDLSQACELLSLQENSGLLKKHLFPIASALPSWTRVEISSQEAKDVRNGKRLPVSGIFRKEPPEKALLCHDAKEMALARLEWRGSLPYWVIIRGLWN